MNRPRNLVRPEPRLAVFLVALCGLLTAALGFPALASAALTFAPATNFDTGTNPTSIAIGDLNDDGRRDLAVASFNSNEVSVLLGTGSGSFRAASSHVAGEQPNSVAIGDLNNDGKRDLAVANFNPLDTTGDVSVLFGTGSGSFGAPHDFDVGSQPLPLVTSIAAGDLNDDGLLDLATANFNLNEVSVLFGIGSGSFAPAVDVDTAGLNPFVVAIGDLNDDGIPDLAASNFSSSTVAVVLADSACPCTFEPATTYPVGTTPGVVAIGDLNNDGRPDLATANRDDDDVSVLLADPTTPGTFAPATSLPVGDNPNGLAIGDLNDDGAPDLAVTNQDDDDVSVLLGSGTGSFGAPTDFATGARPFFLAIGDLDNDGSRDLAVANFNANNVSALLNAPTADASPTSLSFGSAGSPVPQGTTSASQAVTVTNNGSAPLAVSGFSIAGANPDDFFTSTHSCQGDVPPGGSCAVQVRFAPQDQGSRSAALTVLTEAPTDPTVSLAGTAGPLPQGAQGATGSAGPTGASGPQGEKGAPGRDAVIRCVRGKRRSGIVRLSCSVAKSVAKGARILRAKLTSRGKLHATGPDIPTSTGNLRLRATRSVPAGRYALGLRFADRGLVQLRVNVK